MLLSPSLIKTTARVIATQSHLDVRCLLILSLSLIPANMGGGGQNFFGLFFFIYINMAIKKYAPHRILDLTALINQVIHKEFS